MWVEADHSPYKKPNVSKAFAKQYQLFREEWQNRKSQYEMDFEEAEYADGFQKMFGSYFEGIDKLGYQVKFYV